MTEADEALLEEAIMALLLVGFSKHDILRVIKLGSKDLDLKKRIEDLDL